MDEEILERICEAEESLDELKKTFESLKNSINPEDLERKPELLNQIITKKRLIKKLQQSILNPEASDTATTTTESHKEEHHKESRSDVDVNRRKKQPNVVVDGSYSSLPKHKDMIPIEHGQRHANGNYFENQNQNHSQQYEHVAPIKNIPKRVALGIDKGLKASDMSLKPAPPPSESSFARRYVETHQQKTADAKQKHMFLAERVNGFGMVTNVGSQDILAAQKQHSNDEVEVFSKLRINARYIPEENLGQELRGKKVLTVSKVLRKVCYPDYRPLEYPNYVVMGVVAKKNTSKVSRQSEKYMTLTLTDFNSTGIDMPVIIVGQAYDLYWTVREGSLIAILNPETHLLQDSTVPGASVANSTVALKLSSGDNCIIEVGRSSNLGWCSATTLKGARCKRWINAMKTHLCEYHIDQKLKKSSQQRMEFNSTTSRTFSPTKKGRKEHIYMSTNAGSTVAGNPKAHIGYDTHQQAPNKRRTIANFSNAFFLDDDDETAGHYQESIQAQSSAKRRKQKRKTDYIHEKEVRKRLAQLPGGHFLKEYDEKGALIQEPQPQEEDDPESSGTHERPTRIFSAKQVRTIGYDPTKQKYTETAKTNYIPKVSATEVNLSKPRPARPASDEDDSDDGLDII